MTDKLRVAVHELLKRRRVYLTDGGKRCVFCHLAGPCAAECPWIGLQEAFDAATADAPEILDNRPRLQSPGLPQPVNVSQECLAPGKAFPPESCGCAVCWPRYHLHSQQQEGP